jgi:hypothetical protein
MDQREALRSDLVGLVDVIDDDCGAAWLRQGHRTYAVDSILRVLEAHGVLPRETT